MNGHRARLIRKKVYGTDFRPHLLTLPVTPPRAGMADAGPLRRAYQATKRAWTRRHRQAERGSLTLGAVVGLFSTLAFGVVVYHLLQVVYAVAPHIQRGSMP